MAIKTGLARLAPAAAGSGSLATIGGTDAGPILRTVGYMALEQMRGRRSITAPTSSRSAPCFTR